MKENLGWICCLLLLTVLGFSYFSQNSQANTKEIWEYAFTTKRNIEPFNRDQINKMGQEGWEMVAVLPADQNNLTTIFFKRKKQ